MKNLAKITIIIAALVLSFFIGKNYKQQNQKTSNEIVFVWEGLEKDIPEDGEYIQITGTDENTVYLNAIDE